MRVVHICQRDDPDIGGSLRVAEALLHEQQSQGIDAWLIFLYGKPGPVSASVPDRVVALELDSSKQVLKGLFGLNEAIRNIQPDIIHTHDGIMWPRLVYAQLSIPLVMHAHLPAHKNARCFSQSLILKTTRSLIGISTSTMDSWGDAGFPRDRMFYISNGVDFKRFHAVEPSAKKALREQLNLPVDKKILLWLGRLHRNMKGSERAERLARNIPDDTVLVVVGNGPEFEGMLQRNDDLIRSGHLIMTGTTADPQYYFQASDAFLFTSHHEPFGLVILEAIACGLPILAFPVDQGGGAVELLQEFNACKVQDDFTEQDGRDALKAVFSVSSAELHELREKARKVYAWSNKSEELNRVYQGILNPEAKEERAPQVLVCQHGARHRYAIPRMLDKAGMLRAFYTDSSAVSLIGQGVGVLGDRAPQTWKGFSRWNIRGVPKTKIYSSDASYFIELFQRLIFQRKTGIQLYHQRHQVLSSRMKKWGVKEASVIYSMYHEDLDFISWAKQQGARSFIDVFVSPLTDEVMKPEIEAYPHWVGGIDHESVQFEHELWLKTVEVADRLVCPSEWVADGVKAISPQAEAKIRVVPYGCSIDYQGRINKPVKGRLIFGGHDPLRKGLHYLAQAATILKERIPELDVRIAGNMPDAVVNDPLCKDLNFLGQLTSEEMKAEYLSADALVLAALSEGFAGVVAEAIGAGCPVIVTRESGSPIVHEREGLIVPSKNAEALAEGIQRMVENRMFRDQCAASCLEQVPFYSEEAWQGRLVKAICELAEADDAGVQG